MPARVCTVATCNLNQWALDFQGNLSRIRQSILESKRLGATYRLGPELEMCGYGCEDHLLELDTVQHCWECLEELLVDETTIGIVCDIGMPVVHRGVMYNCRVLVLNKRVEFIRPKMDLANDGNYREPRYYATWKHPGVVQDFLLPPAIAKATFKHSCPFGDGILQLRDVLLASETCEELFTPDSPHIGLALAGVEIISNGSGSHHQLRKLDQRLNLIRGATAKAGGVYLYANQFGCDGGRLYYDGCACVAVNGELVAQGSQFGIADVEVVTATVDLDEVMSYRAAVASLREQASSAACPPLIPVYHSLCNCSPWTPTSLPRAPRLHLPEEEIAYGPACWLWDYLRRSGASGFLLPLSGGADSSSTAAIVGAMCQLVIKAVEDERAAAPSAIHTEEQPPGESARPPEGPVAADCRRVAQVPEGQPLPGSAHELAERIFVTVYMGTENSSIETRRRAAVLAGQVGSYHLDCNIDTVVAALVALFVTITGKRPRFRANGGSTAENLALQNIQARLRMVIAFLLAQLVPWVRSRSGWLLVLGSANVDELLRGYLTKYDCSSADINPIGGISKQDLRRFLRWGAGALGYPELANVEAAPPSAELEPLREGAEPQLDEVDMGMTYQELSVYGRLRKVSRCGPVSMFLQCLRLWGQQLSPAAIAEKVKHFFTFYAINRHKATVITPSYHAENYSPDDNRFDHRPFLYNVRWPWQFARIDDLATKAAAEQRDSSD